VLLTPDPQPFVLPVDLIGGQPAGRHPGVEGSLQHAAGQVGLGGEPDLVADAGGAGPLAVVGPGPRQVELAVDQRPTGRRGVGQDDADLAVVDLAGGAGVLPDHPRRADALLDEPGLIDN
jgi:hypothetical protein